MSVLNLIPLVVAFFGFVILTNEALPRLGKALTKREAVMVGATLWGVSVVVITEALSFFGSLSHFSVLVAWLLLIALQVGLRLKLRERKPPSRGRTGPAQQSDQGRSRPTLVLRVAYPVLMTMILLSLVILAAIGLVYPPNNFDSMTYHLPRVMQWAQAGDVEPYATSIERQVSMPPFAEYVVLHTYLLTGSDAFANLVQWFALLLVLVGVSDLARGLGAGKLGQLSSAVLAVSIPMGVLQSTSTQNDLVTGAWLVLFACFVLPLLSGHLAVHSALAAGLSLGLALLTKATVVLYAFPFGLVLLWCLVTKPSAALVRSLMLIPAIAIAVNVGALWRNYSVYRSPITPTSQYVNAEFSVPITLSNVVRNVALHVPLFGRPGLPRRVSGFALNTLRLIHGLTGLAPNDPMNSWTKDDVFTLPFGTWRDEDFAGNSFHTAIIILTVPLVLFRQRMEKRRLLASILLASFVVFSAVLRWQPWISRLQLPAYLLWAPVIASAWGDVSVALAPSLAGVAWILSVPWLVGNEIRPVAPMITGSLPPRVELYFAKGERYEAPFSQAAQQVAMSHCDQVGLVLGEDTWEYPLWVLLDMDGFTGEISHIRVSNATGVLQTSDADPCAILSEQELSDLSDKFTIHRLGEFWLYLDIPSSSGNMNNADTLSHLFGAAEAFEWLDRLTFEGRPVPPYIGGRLAPLGAC